MSGFLFLRVHHIGLLLGVAILACGPDAEPHRSGIEDDAGSIVRLAETPRRIVSLSPVTTELLFDLAVGDRLVGRTRWCQDPPEALAVPSVGDGLPPNVEAVLARRPDLVVFYHSPSNADAVRRIEALGIPTVSVRTDLLADFERAARMLGALLGRRDRADSLIARLHAALDSVAVPAGEDGPSAAIITWDNPPIVLGAGSFLSEIVTSAGLRNAFADLEQPSVTVSIETIAARDPDFLLVTADAPAFARRPEWQVVRAVRQRRFLRVEGTEFGHPSFRMPDAVAQMRAVLQARKP